MNPLTLEALQVLDAIDRKGSFASAATSLNRVPSALSYTVHKLEQDLGVSLFQKQGRRSVLTNAGQHLMLQGRELLTAADALTDSTIQVATGWEPRLRIALDTIIPAELIFPLINRLYEIQPNIEIDLTEEVLGGTWEALDYGRVDLAIGAVGSPPGHKGIRCFDWLTVKSVFVSTPDHPVCQHPQPLSDNIVMQYRSVIIRDSSRHEAPLSRGILNKENFIHVESMEQKIQAHRLGLGIGFVPHFRVEQYLERGELVSLIVENPYTEVPLQIGWKISNRGQARNWLVEQLKQIRVDDQRST
ncbi:MAG TPA: LysR family transcriptional regulator [Gammaproteobacteria bacterium]|nr:HTH-type transcriptional activator AllS [bacterium BMS3Abin11]GMT39453.1 MAG: LysR family transcriptional regulator [bacterium]HDH15842.1 LysR family transcriptional regulator [Gammaproteobacteria bacterium]